MSSKTFYLNIFIFVAKINQIWHLEHQRKQIIQEINIFFYELIQQHHKKLCELDMILNIKENELDMIFLNNKELGS